MSNLLTNTLSISDATAFLKYLYEAFFTIQKDFSKPISTISCGFDNSVKLTTKDIQMPCRLYYIHEFELVGTSKDPLRIHAIVSHDLRNVKIFFLDLMRHKYQKYLNSEEPPYSTSNKTLTFKGYLEKRFHWKNYPKWKNFWVSRKFRYIGVQYTGQIKSWSILNFKTVNNTYHLSIKDVFSNEMRLKIIEHVMAFPGIHFSKLQRQIQLGRGQLAWHLNILEHYCIIHREKYGNRTLYFLELDKNIFQDKLATKPVSQTAQIILDEVKNHPGITSSEIGRLLEINRSTVKYHVDRMKIHHYLRFKKAGQRIRLFAQN
jgi:hypothetical protein